MTRLSVEAPFTLKRVQEFLGLPTATVTRLIAAGFVTPSRGARNEHRFTFQDVMLLRTAHALELARVPPRKILKSLTKLRADLPAELPLTGLRLTAVGSDVVVRDRSGQWNPDSGQLVMDFEVAEVGGSVAFLAGPARNAAETVNWFEQGRELELTDRVAAEQAYRQAIAHEPSEPYAYLNLGAMLCDDGRCAEAVGLFERAADVAGHEPLIHFNHAIALEDQNCLGEALKAYERALAIDADLADAHYNLGILFEKLGNPRAALRHFNAYRRIGESGGT